MRGERLRCAREAHWMTQQELSAASVVPASTISNSKKQQVRRHFLGHCA